MANPKKSKVGSKSKGKGKQERKPSQQVPYAGYMHAIMVYTIAR